VRAIDAHNHVGRWLSPSNDWLFPEREKLIDLLDEANVELLVNLDGKWGAELSENIERYDAKYPGRFITYCHLDWELFQSGGVKPLLAQLRDNAARGARGLKVWKTLGLHYRDDAGKLILPDDPRISEVFDLAAELDLPITIHTADPVAFFTPMDEKNERLHELQAHPDWWFGGAGMPTFMQLMDSLENLIAAHPQTSFLGAHVGCYAENLEWVARMLTTYPNFCVDLGGRVGEIGRKPSETKKFIEDFADRILFGTDDFPPTRSGYRTFFRFLESDDRDFSYDPEHEIPRQGNWTVSGLNLSQDVLEKIYRTNALGLLKLH